MNTQVKLCDTNTGEEWFYMLVFPSDADFKAGELSILSDLGVAILGYGIVCGSKSGSGWKSCSRSARCRRGLKKSASVQY